ncbi:hypothetical protein FRC02_002911 [Tulasnella sp. 418]|nr:hypothetical protein FRC02_002911 [Tulasnella sp. 418]
MNFVGRGGIGVDASGEVDSLKEASGYERSETRNISSNESISWEHCSPVTTVASILDPSSATLSELSTPIAQSGLLPSHDEDQYNPLLSDEINALATAVRDPNVSDNSEFLVPSQWRKTTSSKSRAELVEIARQAIEPAAHYGYISSIQSYQLYLFKSAVANYDRLTCSQLHQNNYWYTSGTNYIYDYLLEGLFNIHFYYIDGWYTQISSSIDHWSVFTG